MQEKEEKEDGCRENRKAESREGAEHLEAFESIPSVISVCLLQLDLSLRESNALVLLTAVLLALPRTVPGTQQVLNKCLSERCKGRGKNKQCQGTVEKDRALSTLSEPNTSKKSS